MLRSDAHWHRYAALEVSEYSLETDECVKYPLNVLSTAKSIMDSSTSLSRVGEQKSGKKSRWAFLLKLLFTLGLIGLVLSVVDFRELLNILVDLNPWYLVAFVVLIHLDRALMSYKWNYLLRALGVEFCFSELFRTYSAAPLSGLLLPSTIGGDLFRFYSLTRFKAKTRPILASIMAERVIGFVALLMVASISLGLASYFMAPVSANFGAIGWTLVLGFMIAASAIGLMYNTPNEYLGRLAGRFRKYPVMTKVHDLYVVFSEYRNNLRTVAIVYGWTFLEQMAPIVGNLLIVRSLHMNVSLVQLVVIIPLIVLAIRIPISFGGLGVQEGLYVALFGLVGVSAAQAFLLSTVTRVLTLGSALPWGIYYIMTVRQMPLPNEELTIVNPQ